MPFKRPIFVTLVIISALISGFSCRPRPTGTVTVPLSDKCSGLDTIATTSPDAAADRVRTLIYNSLVKKSDKLEYVGELAKEIKVGDDNVTVTFTLVDN